jgi:putative protease
LGLETRGIVKPELLIPASSLEVLKTAVRYGADAVYIGGEAFGLRAKAKNFSPEEMAEGIAFAHEHNVRVYVTANILAHNYDLEGARKYFEELKNMQPDVADALIISDPGMFTIAKEVWPEVEIHVSTQANNTNYMTYLFWWKQGAKRVVSARELSLNEIKDIREHIPDEMEIESFIHGAMCISYSGRCLLSNYFTGRDANRGACTHPCRWKYAVVEESRPGEYLPVYENDRGTYIFNSKDLCMIEHIPELVGAGIDSFKIEGRMKTALYVATVARTYRRAIDDYFESEEKYRANMDWYREEIAKCTYRQFTTGFYFGKTDENTQIYDNNTYVNEYTYLGIVDQVTSDAERGTLARFEQRNKFSVGDEIEIMKADGRNLTVKVEAMYDENLESVESCPHSKQILFVRLSAEPECYDLLRVRNSKNII